MKIKYLNCIKVKEPPTCVDPYPAYGPCCVISHLMTGMTSPTLLNPSLHMYAIPAYAVLSMSVDGLRHQRLRPLLSSSFFLSAQCVSPAVKAGVILQLYTILLGYTRPEGQKLFFFPEGPQALKAKNCGPMGK